MNRLPPASWQALPLQENKPDKSGLMVAGSEAGCGKTIITAGLAVLFGSAGFRVQAYKPVAFESQNSHLHIEQAYINKVTQQMIHTDTQVVPSAFEFPTLYWNRIREQCKQFQYPCVLEGIHAVSTPWQIQNYFVKDALDFATELNLAVVLVIKGGKTFLERGRSSASFIQQRGLDCPGFITVYTTAQDETLKDQNQEESLALSREFRMPALGQIPFSPSIGVEQGYHGNLIKLMEENVDLLPLQLEMGLKIE